MKWFDQWFSKKCQQAWDHAIEAPRPNTASIEQHGLGDGLNIHLKQVIGGRLVTFNSYDRRLDRSDSRTYIVTDDQNFECELSKIITLEAMRQC